ncbi:MAG: dihydrofolate reductase [Stagnimonas sp.]|nr:dihydrofolate reductase [Stagnimonas sp.]
MSIASQPSLNLIVAHDETLLIGRDGDLPWRLPNDLKHFKALTLGQTVLMGRKTWESLPRRPLPGRENRVLTRDAQYQAEGATVFTALDAALGAPPQGALFVIGGAALYALCLPRAQRLHITVVHDRADGDTYFPPYAVSEYREIAREDHPADATHRVAYSFVTLERLDAPH